MSATRPDLIGDETLPGSSRREGCVVGHQYGGRFTILSELARGGMGIVYLASDDWNGGRVAFKVLRTAFQLRPVVAARFGIEADFLCKFGSDHIPRGIAHGYDPQCGLYLAMEHLVGKPLDELYGSNTWSPIRVAELGAAIGDAMAPIHAAGIVHRDLTPQNIFLVPKGADVSVKIVDWGLARMPAVNRKVTADDGERIGTVRYMSPELLRGEPASPQSDIYALCVILYELLARRHPFGDDATPEVTIEQLTEWYRTGYVAHLPSINRRVSEHFFGAIETGLHHFPKYRFPSMAQLAKVMRIVRDNVESDAATVLVPVKAMRTLVDEVAEPSKREPSEELAHLYGLGAQSPAERVETKPTESDLANLTHTLPLMSAVKLASLGKGVDSEPPKWALVIQNGPMAGRRFEFTRGAHVIGRSDSAAFVLDELSVSWEHAVIETTSTGALIVTDLSTHNETWVNGVKLRARVPVAIESGSVISVGRVAVAIR